MWDLWNWEHTNGSLVKSILSWYLVLSMGWCWCTQQQATPEGTRKDDRSEAARMLMCCVKAWRRYKPLTSAVIGPTPSSCQVHFLYIQTLPTSPSWALLVALDFCLRFYCLPGKLANLCLIFEIFYLLTSVTIAWNLFHYSLTNSARISKGKTPLSIGALRWWTNCFLFQVSYLSSLLLLGLALFLYWFSFISVSRGRNEGCNWNDL